MNWLKSNILRPLFTLVIALSCAISAYAQTPLFKKLEVLPKISETEIVLIEQDTTGYLWLGTNKGILRYDGHNTRDIQIPDSLLKVQVSAIFVGEKYVYAGFENGCIAVIDKWSFKTISTQKITTSEITSLVYDENDFLWVGSNGSGLFLISENSFKKFGVSEGLADEYVHGLCFVNHQLAVATDLGLSLCRYNSESFTSRNINTDDGLTDNLITAVKTNGEENILLGMENGSMCNLNTNSYRVDVFTKMNEINSSMILKILMLDDEILAITENNGVFVTNWNNSIQVQQFQIVEEGKAPVKPKDAIVDSEGNLMLAFGNHEITIADFRLQFIRQHENESFANAKCIMADLQGNIWFANENGIFRHGGEFSNEVLIEQYFDCKKNQFNIVSLCEGIDHDVWFATFGNGIGHLNLKTKKITLYTEEDGLVNNNVLSLCMHDSTLWMATLGGASTLRFIQKQPVFGIFDAHSKLGSNYIYTVFNDKKNRLWLGTDGKGLVLYEHGTFNFFVDKFPDTGRSVISIAEDEHGNIWFNSADKGLQWTNQDSVYDVILNTKKEKVEVFAIQSDPFGNIVALTSAGIAVLSNHSEHIAFLPTGFEVIANYLNVIARDEKGRMWLGTEEAMIRYSDFSIGKKMKPRPYIESIEVMLVPIDTSQHEFKFDENHFTFELTSIWFQEPEAIQFQYKLIGYDTSWVTTRDHKVIFSRLQPGNYTFLMRSAVNEDWERANLVSYKFKIRLPFWRELWFIASIVVLFFGSVYVLILIRIRRVKQRELAAIEKVQSQFDALRNQVNPHFIFNSFNTLISIIGSDQQAAIGYVEKLSDYFRIVLQQRDKDVITLKEELELVQSYLFLQEKRFGKNLIVKIDVNSNNLASMIPPMTLQILAENAIKHNSISKLRPLHISIYSENENLIVSNNIQEKITKEPSTGIGLENIKHRYRILFKKDIFLEKNEETFMVRLPIVND